MALDAVRFSPVNPSTGGLFRVSGDAIVNGKSRSWSLVVKRLQVTPNSPDDPTHWNYWRREVLSYQSGILDEMPPGLRAPRLAEGLVTSYTHGYAAAGHAAAAPADERIIRAAFTITASLRAFGFTLPLVLRAGADPANAGAVAFAPRLGAAVRALLPCLEESLALL